MRVGDQIFLLSGAKRAAAYDFSSGVVWSCTPEEEALLRWMASGRDWQDFSYSGDAHNNLKLVQSLSSKHLVTRGACREIGIEFPVTAYQKSSAQRLKHVWLELTNACNLTCKHCYSSSSPRADRSGELDVARWSRIIHGLASVGVDTLTYIGGEPTLRLKEIAGLIDLVKASLPRTRQRIFSNLAIKGIATKIAEIADQCDMEVGTSLYGTTARAHDAMTHRPGSWGSTTENIRVLLHSNVNLFVGFYLSESSRQAQDEATAWLRQLGVRRFKVLSPSAVGRGAGYEWKKHTPDSSAPPTRLEFPTDERSFTSGHNCFKDHLAISADGEVRPCIMMRDTSYGSLREGIEVTTILETVEFQRLAELSKEKIDGCSVCEFRYGCFDCRPDAMAGGVDIHRKPNCGYDPRL